MEIWKEIQGFEGRYEISTDGRIRTVERLQRYLLRNKQPAMRLIPAHFLSTQLQNKGYRIVHLWKDDRRYVKTVHRLVALAFLPNPQRKKDVHHRDRNRANPALLNLEWLTRSENLKRIRQP
jgi:hypothetical protein